MRELFKIDTGDYVSTERKHIRPSVRAIIIVGDRVAMVYSRLYNYYKFPGGGIESGETMLDALMRETLEESGLVVIPESVREYGCVPRIQATDREDYDVFVQDNYYYLCSVREGKVAQRLDDYEETEGFTLKLVTPKEAIDTNRHTEHGPKCPVMLNREARVLEMLVDEGYIPLG